MRWLPILVAALAIPAGLGGQVTRGTPDPVRADPPTDPASPPTMAGVSIPSAGARLVGSFYLAGGAGPHPTVVLLHGFPGFEQNGDLAQAIRRAGWNVLLAHYRGSWGSGGDFSLAGTLDDVAAMLAYLRGPATARLRVDPARIALVGHSMGAWAALTAAAADTGVHCVAGLGVSNMGAMVRAMTADTTLRARLGRALAASLASNGGPIRAASVEAMQAGITPDAADLLLRVTQLRGRTLLLVGARADEQAPLADNHTPLAAAFRAAGASRLTDVVLPGDHSFSGSRLALADAVVGWLNRSCPR